MKFKWKVFVNDDQHYYCIVFIHYYHYKQLKHCSNYTVGLLLVRITFMPPCLK